MLTNPVLDPFDPSDNIPEFKYFAVHVTPSGACPSE